MGWRFHRSKQIIPGVRLNFSRSGLSVSVGVKGARVNLGKSGIRTTLGLPGTGISHVTYQPWHATNTKRQSMSTRREVPMSPPSTGAAYDNNPNIINEAGFSIWHFLAVVIVGGPLFVWAGQLGHDAAPSMDVHTQNAAAPMPSLKAPTTAIAPTMAQAGADNLSTPYTQGLASRSELETWTSNLSASTREGALWWAGERGKRPPRTCPNAHGIEFLLGCQAAKEKLAPIDRRRLSEPEFRRGWNSYINH